MKQPYFPMMKAWKSSASLFFVFLFVLAFRGFSQPTIALSAVITSGLDQPMQFVNAGDASNRVFIVQKEGTIRSYDSTFQFISNFLTVTGITSAGERGLLSMAFHPDYPTNGFFYVHYTNANGDIELARYHVSSSPDSADVASKVILITIPHPTFDNHNGGELHFGSDGYLYLSTGDGGSGGDPNNNAQNTSVLLGKILRFDVNTSNTAPYYSVPPSNPYGNEIFALGLRNPFRWSFDRQTGDMWIGDVGQGTHEEIDFSPAANTLDQNYGWRCYEGNQAFNTSGCQASSNYTFPVYEYPTQSPAAVTGGMVYRGSAYANLVGWYLSADFYSGVWYKIASDGAGGWVVDTQHVAPTGIVDYGEMENGELYVVSNTNNSVHRVTANLPTGVQQLSSEEQVRIYPTLVPDGIVHTWLPSSSYTLFEVMDAGGRKLKEIDLRGQSGDVRLPLNLASGIYFCRIIGAKSVISQKIIVE